MFSFQTLVGKIERIGISNIMGAPGALSLSAGMYNRPALTSPMAQLTCLLPSHSRDSISSIKEVPDGITSPDSTNGKSLIFAKYNFHKYLQ